MDLLAADEGIDEGQFGGAGVTEDVLDAFGLEGFEQHVCAATNVGVGHEDHSMSVGRTVITSYSIHYTKLYEGLRSKDKPAHGKGGWHRH